ncbi:carbamoyl phosphate synthase small subunit [Sutcliffiella horikoshii]|uniref:Carbamoyl phosphate synthase small chain n=1 Tax=Sutcliffiella horikoshii TaxID=79883 RepID=A0A5D4SGG0_9BACI|nr:carbamoyl phosphate synthase small subunit [Sutcliffiella horikoshii]TYS62565.1 carbamoyl phosphate synthase small subunit [Sutcliffiella horikoshii]
MDNGYLVLETGEVFPGSLIGSKRDAIGEVVFNTSMTGYQEIMSDPSYAGQIIVFCYPLIGNYGINPQDFEAENIYAKGVIMGEACYLPNHYSSEVAAPDLLSKLGISGLSNVDTREIVKTIRKRGSVKGFITDSIKDFPDVIVPENWVELVSTPKIKNYPGAGPHIVLLDYGYKKSILEALLHANCQVTVVPYNTSLEEVEALQPDGVLLSNGPGNPEVLKNHLPKIKKIAEQFPTLGICLGHQLLAMAFGARTEKLLFGHRGGNHPVKDLATGKVYITSQNHSYNVKEDSINLEVFSITYKNINDGTVEGLHLKNFPALSVQFHPEAHPGPQDTNYIFEKFLTLIHEKTGVMSYAI